MSEQRPAPDSKLRALASQIAELDINTLIRPALASPYTFEDAKGFFENVLSFYKDVSVSNLIYVPRDKLDNMTNKAESVLKALLEVREFNVQSVGDPKEHRNRLIGRLSSEWREAYNQAIPDLAFAKVSSAAITQELLAVRTALSTVQADWKKASDDYKGQKDSAEKQLAGRMGELEKVLTAAREASARSAVSAQASEFEREAGRSLEQAKRWLWATVGAVVLSLIVIYVAFLKDFHRTPIAGIFVSRTNQVSESVTNSLNLTQTNQTALQSEQSTDARITAGVVQQTVARILILTFLYGAVVWCARNYFACRHNYTVNRHRRNAMQTFKAFVEGTDDPATKDFVLRQAAACAFAPQQTGYLKDEALPIPAPATQVIDVFKSAGAKE